MRRPAAVVAAPDTVEVVRDRLRAATTADELDEALGTADRVARLIADGRRTLDRREALLARVEADLL